MNESPPVPSPVARPAATVAPPLHRPAVFPAVLLSLHGGPVQAFITPVRDIHDLWSGSFLLSWLMAAGLNTICRSASPATVVYPRLENSPLFDLHWRANRGHQPHLEDPADHAPEISRNSILDLLTPSLPNLLLAVVPSAPAESLARSVEAAIRAEWHRIAQAVWHHCAVHGLLVEESQGNRTFAVEQRHEHFNAQIDQFLAIHWQITPLPKSSPPDWPAHCLRNLKELKAVRQLCAFTGSASLRKTGVMLPKDSLSGAEEAIAGGPRWRQQAEAKGGRWPSLFPNEDWLSAVSLVKRLWTVAYLDEDPWSLHVERDRPALPRIDDTALRGKVSSDSSLNPPLLSDTAATDRSFAVLQLQAGPLPLFCVPEGNQLAKVNSSEARTIVEQCEGRLIYSCGNDVLAILPADTAIACAQALRAWLRDSQETMVEALHEHRGGDGSSQITGDKLSPPRGFMGPMRSEVAVEVWAGIAMGPVGCALPTVVRAAQTARRRAQNQPGQPALALRIVQSDGEKLDWHCPWDSGGIELQQAITAAIEQKQLDRGFPGRWAGRLENYRLRRETLAAETMQSDAEFAGDDIIVQEFSLAFEESTLGRALPQYMQDHGPFLDSETKRSLVRQFLKNLPLAQSTADPIDDWLRAVIDLCRTVRFTVRREE